MSALPHFSDVDLLGYGERGEVPWVSAEVDVFCVSACCYGGGVGRVGVDGVEGAEGVDVGFEICEGAWGAGLEKDVAAGGFGVECCGGLRTAVLRLGLFGMLSLTGNRREDCIRVDTCPAESALRVDIRNRILPVPESLQKAQNIWRLRIVRLGRVDA